MYAYNTFYSDEPQITGRFIDVDTNSLETDNLNNEITQSEPEIEEETEEPRKTVREIPTTIKYNTFTVYPGKEEQALILFDLTYDEGDEDRKYDTTIDFDNTKYSKGFDELKEYLIENDFNVIILYARDSVNGEDINGWATNLRRSTGISVIIKFASGTRNPDGSISVSNLS